MVGIAGAAEKCQYAVEELGYDACVSHYDDDMAEQLAGECPDGIDVYFENVGGSSWEAVMPLLNDFARVPVCGLIAHYTQNHPISQCGALLNCFQMTDVKHIKDTVHVNSSPRPWRIESQSYGLLTLPRSFPLPLMF